MGGGGFMDQCMLGADSVNYAELNINYEFFSCPFLYM